MTPIDLAESLAKSDNARDRAEGVAIIVRGLTDFDPNDPTRQGWPLNASTVAAAARFVGLEPTPELVAEATAIAPTLPDAILNIGAVLRADLR